ncbi:hypothetical protein CERSUDRAFT_101101 [Gelatoporia subvermispora B]|uniref:Uncharacterized protein n=1 Tax=Ceriporiopsis subvermispora (strain B) TaxID=914234 RepID=M2Q1I9_CERS8|nr:hypothetical protein CERSUDRAFT_101101 [Gelatoporia subvermispora B]
MVVLQENEGTEEVASAELQHRKLTCLHGSAATNSFRSRKRGGARGAVHADVQRTILAYLGSHAFMYLRGAQISRRAADGHQANIPRGRRSRNSIQFRQYTPTGFKEQLDDNGGEVASMSLADILGDSVEQDTATIGGYRIYGDGAGYTKNRTRA